MDTFFHIYPVIPIIDETDFNTSINRVLGPQIDGHYINSFPSIGSADDLPFWHCSCWCYESHTCTHRCMSVSYDTLRAAETIMKEFDITKTHSLTALQAEIMLRFYKIVAPELYTEQLCPSKCGCPYPKLLLARLTSRPRVHWRTQPQATAFAKNMAPPTTHGGDR